VVIGKVIFVFEKKRRCLFILRGGSRGIDDGIFPRRMEIDWIRYYQWR